MVNSIPNLADMTAPYDEAQERLADLSPVWPAVQRRFNEIKQAEFSSGRGPDGPHKPIKASTRARHRTGVPLWNSKNLGRSHYDPGHVHYHWEQDAAGWEHRSSHPALARLRRQGYVIDGLSMESWDELEAIVAHYINTGEILS